MTVELHKNGHLIIELQPEDDFDRLMLQKMTAAAERGSTVSLVQGLGTEVLVSVENQ